MQKNSAPARRAKSRNEPNKSHPLELLEGRRQATNGAFKLKPAAEYLGGLSKPTMYRLIARGLLRPNRATRIILFTKSELDRFLADGMA